MTVAGYVKAACGFREPASPPMIHFALLSAPRLSVGIRARCPWAIAAWTRLAVTVARHRTGSPGRAGL